MIKTTVKIDGMQCNIIEEHVRILIRKKSLMSQKVKNIANGECVIVSPDEIPRERSFTHEAGERQDHKVTEMESEPYVKKGAIWILVVLATGH